MFIVTLLLADRLIRNRKRLPLPLALAYALPAASMMGNAVSRAGGETALAGGIAIALALAFVLLVVRLRGALAGLPAARGEDAPTMREQGPEAPALHPMLQAGHIAAFAATYGLSEQETLVMEMLAQSRSSEEIAAALAVKTGTVRVYISRLMHKTGADNRAALMARYAAQSPVAARAADSEL